MKMVKISELRDHLSRYLDHVRAGGRVLILDRNRPVAEIVPAGTSRPSDREAEAGRLAELEREGLVRRGSGPIPNDILERPGPGRGAGVLDALLDERRRGR